MVCLFLLPVIAITTPDCLILIGCWKVSSYLIGSLKKLSCRTKWSTPLDWGGSGPYAGAHKKFVPFFWTHFIFWQSVAINISSGWTEFYPILFAGAFNCTSSFSWKKTQWCLWAITSKSGSGAQQIHPDSTQFAYMVNKKWSTGWILLSVLFPMKRRMFQFCSRWNNPTAHPVS